MNYKLVSQSERKDNKRGGVFNYEYGEANIIISVYQESTETSIIDSLEIQNKSNAGNILSIVEDKFLLQITKDACKKSQQQEIKLLSKRMFDNYTVIASYNRKEIKVSFSEDYTKYTIIDFDSNKQRQFTEEEQEIIARQAKDFAKQSIYTYLNFDQRTDSIYCASKTDERKYYTFLALRKKNTEKTKSLIELLNTIEKGNAFVSVKLTITIYCGEQSIVGTVNAFILKDLFKDNLLELELTEMRGDVKVEII